MELTERIQYILNSKEMTQADLSRAAGLSTAQVSQIMSGKVKDPRLSTIAAIAEALNVSLDYLAFGRERVTLTDYTSEKLANAYRKLNQDGRRRLADEAELYVRSEAFKIKGGGAL